MLFRSGWVSAGARVLGRRAGLGGGLGGGLGRRLGGRLGLVGGNIEDVQDATGGWLGGGVFTWVVGDVVAIDNVLEGVSMVEAKLDKSFNLRSTSIAGQLGAGSLGT